MTGDLLTFETGIGGLNGFGEVGRDARLTGGGRVAIGTGGGPSLLEDERTEEDFAAEGERCSMRASRLGLGGGEGFSSCNCEKERIELGVEGAEGVGVATCRLGIDRLDIESVVRCCRFPKTARTARDGLGDGVLGGLIRPDGAFVLVEG